MMKACKTVKIKYICCSEVPIMKNPLRVLFIFSILLCVFSCSEKQKPTANNFEEQHQHLQKTQFYIDGLGTDEACPTLFKDALEELKDIKDLQIDCHTKKVTLSFNTTSLNLENIALAIVTLKDGHTFKVYDMELIP